MVETKLKRPDGLFFRTLNELVIKIYSQGSQLVHILYECLPELLIKFQSYLQLGAEEKENNQRLKGKQQVNSGIDAVVLNIYNYELPSYNLYLENIKVTELPQLTRIFGEVEMVRQSYAPEKEVTFSNKFRLVFWLMQFRNRSCYLCTTTTFCNCPTTAFTTSSSSFMCYVVGTALRKSLACIC